MSKNLNMTQPNRPFKRITIMKQKDIIDAWVRIRTIDQTIPDDVLDFMKDAAIAALKTPPRDYQLLLDALAFELEYAKIMSDPNEFRNSSLPKRLELLNISAKKMIGMIQESVETT